MFGHVNRRVARMQSYCVPAEDKVFLARYSASDRAHFWHCWSAAYVRKWWQLLYSHMLQLGCAWCLASPTANRCHSPPCARFSTGCAGFDSHFSSVGKQYCYKLSCGVPDPLQVRTGT
jgi:hypothetical protein